VTEPRQGLAAITADDRFRAADAITPSALLDAGLPLALFTVVYTAAGRELTIALWAALGAGVVLAAVRLVRREPLQNVIAGFVGLGLAVFVSARTGRAEDVFLPGLLINVGYGLAYLVSAARRVRRPGHRAGYVVASGPGSAACVHQGERTVGGDVRAAARRPGSAVPRR
jgi:hypothetical protein